MWKCYCILRSNLLKLVNLCVGLVRFWGLILAKCCETLSLESKNPIFFTPVQCHNFTFFQPSVYPLSSVVPLSYASYSVNLGGCTLTPNVFLCKIYLTLCKFVRNWLQGGTIGYSSQYPCISLPSCVSFLSHSQVPTFLQRGIHDYCVLFITPMSKRVELASLVGPTTRT